MSRILHVLVLVTLLTAVPKVPGQTMASSSGASSSGASSSTGASSSLGSFPSAAVSQAANAEEIPLRSFPAHRGTSEGSSRAPTTGRTLTTVVGALAICLGVFFLLVWVTKRHSPAGLAVLPKEVVESLGRSSLNGRQYLQLLRIGRKLVLLHVTPTGAESLTEIDDPAEVDRLVGLCQQNSANSVTTSFREVLTHYEKEPAGQGFLGDATQSDWELATRSSRKRPARREDLNA